MHAFAHNLDLRILGLGQTGLSCLRWAVAAGLRPKAFDTRAGLASARPWAAEFPGCTLRFGDLRADALLGADLVLVSPGLAPTLPALRAAREAGIALWSDIELFGRLARAPIAAITGSNGKSTVTTLLGEMAKTAGRRVAVGGNLGTPALDLLPEAGAPEPELYVLELSSFQLHYCHALRPRVAAILNLSPDHLDWHGDMEAYLAAKARIFRTMGEGDTLVLNGEDPALQSLPAKVPAGVEIRRFGHTPQLDAWADDLALHWPSAAPMPLADIHLPGKHNGENVLAAALMATALNLPETAIRQAAADFRGLPHRLQWVARVGGVDYYDDSKGTNLGASLRAMEALPGPLVLILGGDAKGADLSPLREALRGQRGAVLLGKDAAILEAILAGTLPTLRIGEGGMSRAVRAAAAMAQPGDQVLLSPACASLDMFRDYRDRGRQFAAAVQALAEEVAP